MCACVFAVFLSFVNFTSFVNLTSYVNSSLVGMYWKEFGPLPMERSGKKVLDLLMAQKGFTYDGNMKDWITVRVRISDASKQSGVFSFVTLPCKQMLTRRVIGYLPNK